MPASRRGPFGDWLHAQLTQSAPARPLALVRIVVGVCLIAKGFEIALLLPRLLRPETLRVPWLEGTPALPAITVAPFLVAWFTAAVLFTEGRRARAAGVFLLLAFVYLCAFDLQLWSYHTYLAFLLLLLLVVGDSVAALSREAQRRGERGAILAWPVTLLKAQMTVMYGYAVVAKVYNSAWLREGVLARFMGLPPDWGSPALRAALDGSAIALEAFVAFGLWARRTRPWALLVGFAFHVAIPLVLDPKAPLIVFSVLSLGPYVLFLDAWPASRRVFYDPASPRQARRATWCARLDWLALHRFEPRPGADWEVEGPDGTRRGFRGLVAVLEGLPLTFLWAPALRLLGGRNIS